MQLSNDVPLYLGSRVSEVMPPQADATAGAITLTANQILCGILLHTGGAARSDTTPTGPNLALAIGKDLRVGTVIEFTLVPGDANIYTLLAGNGVTLKGATANFASIAGTSATYKFVCTALPTDGFVRGTGATFDVYRM